jgi:hypothetical protein
MQSNVGIQNQGVIVWDGAASYPRDITKHVRFGFVFEIVTTLAADTIFNVQAAPESAADPCLPGTFVPVPEISICDIPAVAGPQASVFLPAGTLAGTICAGTIPCRPNKFVQLVGGGGDVANVRIVMVRQGPIT